MESPWALYIVAMIWAGLSFLAVLILHFVSPKPPAQMKQVPRMTVMDTPDQQLLKSGAPMWMNWWPWQ